VVIISTNSLNFTNKVKNADKGAKEMCLREKTVGLCERKRRKRTTN
jgi:hypothetical protein